MKEISKKATSEAILRFKSDKKCIAAHNEVKSYIAKRLHDAAEEGFYDTVYILINRIEKPRFKYNKLSKKNQDILKELIRNRLRDLGYKVIPVRYDKIGIHWAISWE